jgi:hypothetical protein
MHLMLAAVRAELFELQPLGRRFLVLHVAVVPILALRALERNNFARHAYLLLMQ